MDKRVALTIADIVADYYQLRNEVISLYICDSSDGRQAARKRKFDGWFEFFNQADFLKHDLTIVDEKDGITYYNAIILKTDNPQKTAIIAAFDDLFGRYNDPK